MHLRRHRVPNKVCLLDYNFLTPTDVKIAFFLFCDEFRHKLGMVRQIGVHDEDEVSGCMFDPMDVGCA